MVGSLVATTIDPWSMAGLTDANLVVKLAVLQVASKFVALLAETMAAYSVLVTSLELIDCAAC